MEEQKDAAAVEQSIARLARAIAGLDPDDLGQAATMVRAHGQLSGELAALGPSAREAAELYRAGQTLETKLRIGRAKLAAQAAELYQTSFLLRAMASDLPGRETAGSTLDVQA